MSEKNHCDCADHTHEIGAKQAPPTTIPDRIEQKGQQAKQLRISIRNMDCPTEESLIRLSLGSLAGVSNLDFDLLNRILTVHHNLDDTNAIFKKLEGIGMPGHLIDPSTPKDHETKPLAISRKKIFLISLAGTAAISSEVLHWFGGQESGPTVIILALIAILASGLPTLKKGWIALRHFTLNIHFLMATAVMGAMAIGQWPEAAVVISLFGIAEMIEALSLDRARNAIAGLMTYAPVSAAVLHQDKQWVDTPVQEISLGQRVRARAGERIALDGIVESGHSSVDQSPITGESMPQEKTTGDLVYAGTLNQSGNLEIRVTSLESDTMLARIARSVQDAQSQRAPTQSFVDRFASRYTPIVFMIAVAIALFPPLLGLSSWHDSVYQALVLLVIACPCALVISTPVTVVSGLALAAKRGILIKGGLYLELGRKLTLIALDKTGTLTHGKPSLTDVIAVAELSEQEIQHIAASLEAGSQHPVAHALLNAYTGALAEVTHFSSQAVHSVTGEIHGQRYYLGNQRMLNELCQTSAFSLPANKKADLINQMEQLEAQKKTVVLLCDAHQVLGIFAMADTLRATSQTAIKQLQMQGIQLVMLTGDNKETAQAIAKETGITEVRSELLPDEKLQAIAKFSAEEIVGMVGDGVNDAPALARAHIGFAMGVAGSDTALEIADVALMQDDLRKLPEFIRISQRTTTILWQNISFALVVKAVFFVLTLIGYSSMWLAVFADTGTSLLVVLNGLRLLKYDSERV
jgi:Cd2+/Zn2+-exporting ATPase